MSEFDDTIHTDRDPQPEPSVGTANQKKLESKSLIEMLTGDGDINQLGKQLNLDSDMTEKVLLPLINFLDKYGVGESLSTNQTVNKGVGLFGFVSDVAPILRSATEYFQGKKTEPVGPPPSNPFTDGPVDWNEMLGVTSPSHNVNQSQYSSIAQAKKQTFGGITGIEALAAEQGLSIAQITNDRQSATNSGGVSSSNVDYTNNDSLNSLVMSGMDEIQRAMKGEQNRQAAQSKVIFEGEKLATPDAITQYSPNIDHVPAAPTMKGLETMEDMMARQGITTFEERKPSSEEVEMFDEGEMEFIESTNSFRNKDTGDEYEAVLTQVPESYFDQPIQTFQSAIETPAPIQDIVEMMQEEIIEESIITPTYYNMLVTELKSELKAAGLSQVGTKKELIQRLNNSEE